MSDVGGDLAPLPGDQVLDREDADPTSVSEWAPCHGCTFAGEVGECSAPSLFGGNESTARTSDPFLSEGDVTVGFVENEGTAGEVRTGNVTLRLSGESYGSGDDEYAAQLAATAIRGCAKREAGPIEGRRSRFSFLGLGLVQACAAFAEVDAHGVVVRRQGVLQLKNANGTEIKRKFKH